MNMLSLFSGIGGIDLAAEWAGMETVGFCEIDHFCQKVLKKHWPNVPIFNDVRKINKEMLEDAQVPQVDIIAGGFPCQPFSTAGKRRGTKDDRNLFPEMVRLITEIKPSWVVGENVAGFTNMALDALLTSLETIGYTALPFIIPACAVNAPHRRDRVFVVAHSSSDGWTSNIPWKSRRTKIETCYPRTWNGKLLDKSPVQRVVDGIPTRLDKGRLKALGNAVVPYQIYPIFKAIMDIDKAK